MSRASSKGLAPAGGAIVSAVASSACCWVPLLLMAFGLSAGGVSAWFEKYRLLFLIIAGSLLAVGFYSAYFTTRRCDSACACDRPAPRMQRITRSMLWVSAVIVVGFAAFPKYVGVFIGDNGAPTGSATSTSVGVRVTGMTCEACAIHLQQTLTSVPGVSEARVSYADGTATLFIDPGANFRPQAALHAISDAGYSGTLEGENSQKGSP